MLLLFRKFLNFIGFVFKQDVSIRKQLAMALCLTLVMSCMAMGLPLLFSHIIQLLTDKHESLIRLIPLILIGYGLLWIANQLMENIRSIIVFYILEGSGRAVSHALFVHLNTLSIRFHTDKQIGAIMSNMNRAQYGLETLFYGILLYALPTILEVLLILILITYWYGPLSLVLLLALVLYVFLNLYVMRKSEKLHEEYRKKRSKANAKMLDSLINIETVRFFNNQKIENERIDMLLREQEAAGIKKNWADVAINLAQSLIIGFVFILITWVTGTAVVSGEHTIADFILLNAYLLQCIMLFRSVFIIQQIRKGLHDIAATDELIALQPEIQDSVDAQELVGSTAEIQFDRVWFSYDIGNDVEQEKFILKDISFVVPAGKTVAIVGPSGAGKSTLARLLFRFYEVSAGSIRINGIDIKMITQDSLHQAVGIVPQNTQLFNDTLYSNIAYGKPDATQAQIHTAAADAQLAPFIERLGVGYQTMVGEQGLKLSGGERQRVAIARVLLKKPSIYIFDEATSSLDSNTEKEIQKTLQEISVGSTTLIIAHRLSTIMHADSIIVLDEGRIVERDTHAQLLAHNGLYAKLWNTQINGPDRA